MTFSKKVLTYLPPTLVRAHRQNKKKKLEERGGNCREVFFITASLSLSLSLSLPLLTSPTPQALWEEEE